VLPSPTPWLFAAYSMGSGWCHKGPYKEGGDKEGGARRKHSKISSTSTTAARRPRLLVVPLLTPQPPPCASWLVSEVLSAGLLLLIQAHQTPPPRPGRYLELVISTAQPPHRCGTCFYHRPWQCEGCGLRVRPMVPGGPRAGPRGGAWQVGEVREFILL